MVVAEDTASVTAMVRISVVSVQSLVAVVGMCSALSKVVGTHPVAVVAACAVPSWQVLLAFRAYVQIAIVNHQQKLAAHRLVSLPWPYPQP